VVSFFPKLSVVLALVSMVTAPLSCWPTGTDTDGPPSPDPSEIDPTLEVEPNDSADTATPAAFDASGYARLQGNLPAVEPDVPFDIDYYNLGALNAGDRLIIDVNVLAPNPRTVVAVFDADGKLFVLDNGEESAAGVLDPFADEVIRHDSDAFYLLFCRSLLGENAAVTYEIVITLERDGPAPSPRPQTVLLDFDGDTLTIPNLGPTVIPPFDAGDIDDAYLGQTAIVKERIVDTVRQNYARFDIEILDGDREDPPADSAYSTVYFGGYDPAGLGIALNGTDVYNADPADDAIVFTGRFTPELFTNPPDAEPLGVAIGNIAAHEIGHLLGLNHVRDDTALMNGYDAPDHLLTDQRFENARLDIVLLPSFDLTLGQDASLLLAETVGLAPVASDVDLPVGDQPSALAVADFDNDGDADAAVASTLSSDVRVLWNDGGAFTLYDYLVSGLSGPSALVAEDLDGDGDVDLAVANLVSDDVAVWLNDGTGLFPATVPVNYPVQDGPLGLAAADLDDDGDLDLAAAHSFANNVSILLNAGDGTFSEDVIVSEAAFAASISAADFDGDGDQDLAFANTGLPGDGGPGGDGEQPGGAWIALNNGDATFDNEVLQIAPLAVGWSVATADLNGNGNLDVVLADTFTGAAVVAINQGDAGLADPISYLAGQQSTSVAAGDLDGNGDLDLAVANAATDDVSVLFNRGDGTFEPQWPYRVGDEPSAVTMLDLDDDGDLDLLVANAADDTVSILLNNGDKTFGRRPGEADDSPQ